MNETICKFINDNSDKFYETHRCCRLLVAKLMSQLSYPYMQIATQALTKLRCARSNGVSCTCWKVSGTNESKYAPVLSVAFSVIKYDRGVPRSKLTAVVIPKFLKLLKRSNIQGAINRALASSDNGVLRLTLKRKNSSAIPSQSTFGNNMVFSL